MIEQHEHLGCAPLSLSAACLGQGLHSHGKVHQRASAVVPEQPMQCQACVITLEQCVIGVNFCR